MFEDGEMDNFENELTSNQTETLIQFQEVTGIDDISICRDNLHHFLSKKVPQIRSNQLMQKKSIILK